MCLDDLDCCDILCGALCAVCCIQMCKSSSPPPQSVVVHQPHPIYQQPQGYQTGPYPPQQQGYNPYPQQGYPPQQPGGYPPYQGQPGFQYPGPVQQSGHTYHQGAPINVQPVRSGFDGQPPSNPGFAPPPYQ